MSFRKNTVAIKVRGDILKVLPKGEITIAVMADYLNAFTKLDYEILISKLYRLIFWKKALTVEV